MKKILFIVNSLPFFLSHRKPIADRLIKEGYEVHIAAGKMDASPPANLIWHELPLERGGTKLIGELKAFFSILKVIKKTKPDLVHLVSIKPVLYGGIILNFFPKIPVVSAISGLGSIFTNPRRFKFLRFIISTLYKVALRKKNLIVIFQNSDDKKTIMKLTNLDESKTRLIKGSGVDLKVFNYSEEPSTENGINVTMISRLLKDKGIIEFIEASKILENEPITFNIVGGLDPQNPESLTESDVQNFSTIKNLHFHGAQTNIPKYIKDSHIIVLPSYREGLPKVLCEAAACGRAVITTDVPGCRDAINQNTGVLVPVKKACNLANSILQLSSDHNFRKYLGGNGKILAETEYNQEIIINKHLNIYLELTLKR